MAKKLIRNYAFIPGTAGEGVISFPGNYTLDEILLVTNVTVDTAQVTDAAPFSIAGRLTWTESQA